MSTGTAKGHKVREAETSKEFRDDLTALLSGLEGPDYVRVADAVIFSSDGFKRFLGDYRKVVMELMVDTLKVWYSATRAPDAELSPAELASLLNSEKEAKPRRKRAKAQAEMGLEALMTSQAAHLAARRKLAQAEAALARLQIDEELGAAAADLLKRADAALEEEAADLRADAADLLEAELRERVLRSELALRDVEAARAKGDLVSLEELDAELERDVPG